jgi:hypothetical protein
LDVSLVEVPAIRYATQSDRNLDHVQGRNLAKMVHRLLGATFKGLTMKQLQFASSTVAGAAAIAGFALTLGLMACAQVSDGSLLIFSSRVPAIALVNGQLLQGEVQLMPDRTGSATLTNRTKPLSTGSGADNAHITSCVGQLRYTSSVAGAIDLRCSGGVAAELAFTMLSETRGYAYSQTPGVSVSMTYGLTPDEARAYLKVPDDKRLLVRPGSAYLELR